jgi:membrane protein YqaA with SNARE-associated domain
MEPESPKKTDEIEKILTSEEQEKLRGRLVLWFKKNAQKKSALIWLNIISFTESSFFPIPIDPFMALLILANEKKWFRIVCWLTFTSVLGGVFGYLIGMFLFEVVGQPIVNLLNLQSQADYLAELFRQNAFWAMFIAAFTPVPYKIFTITAGLFQVNIFIFIIASIIGRGLRFFLVGFIFKFLGERYGEKIFKHFDKLLFAGVVLLILYFIFH